MQNYFPYSSIYSSSDSQHVTKHSYTGDWQIIRTSAEETSPQPAPAISEIYY